MSTISPFVASSRLPTNAIFPLLQRLRRLVLNFTQAQISAGAGSVVDYGLMILGVEVFGWELFWALACGGVVGAVVNFSLNRYWTFRDKGVAYDSGLGGQILKFATTVVGSILLKYLGTYALEHYVGIDYKIGKLISDLFVSVLFNYTLQRFWVFRKQKP